MRTIVACSSIGVVAVIALGAYRLSSERNLAYVPYHGPPVVIRDDESTSTLFALLGSVSASAQNNHTLPDEPVPPFPDAKKYASAKYGFFLYVPEEVEVQEERTEGYLYTLFKDVRSRRGFQVFATPYTLPKITDERFYLDEPSGIMNQPVNITLNGIPATKFLSMNDAMGESTEVWFLRGGYLYEITAPKALDAWLMSILETWRFT